MIVFKRSYTWEEVIRRKEIRSQYQVHREVSSIFRCTRELVRLDPSHIRSRVELDEISKRSLNERLRVCFCVCLENFISDQFCTDMQMKMFLLDPGSLAWMWSTLTIEPCAVVLHQVCSFPYLSKEGFFFSSDIVNDKWKATIFL